MSSTLIDSPDVETIASATPGAEAHPNLPIRRAWLVAAALVAATALGLAVAWQTATAASASAAPPAAAPPAAQAAPAAPGASVGAGLLSLAWELTPPSQHDAACAQFAADPGAAWAAYSSAAQVGATRAEFTAFFTAAC
jgi:hypothetical protein